jgi:hypothetical protein
LVTIVIGAPDAGGRTFINCQDLVNVETSTGRERHALVYQLLTQLVVVLKARQPMVPRSIICVGVGDVRARLDAK